MTMTLTRLRASLARLANLDHRLDDIKINQGLILCEFHRNKPAGPLSDFEFKVFSQWGEDGIIQHLVRNIQIANRTFIEFGVEDFTESNGRFLLMKDHWQGFVIDGSDDNMTRLRSSHFYWKHPLKARAAFVDRDNVVSLLDESGFDKDLGILSVDVDGMDYHLLERLSHWRARIVIVEYNSAFGSTRAVTVPYDASFVRSKAHGSNLYWGASLPAFQQLLGARGYALVGVNSVGSNAFFVRHELLNERVPEVSMAVGFRDSTFRETRGDAGELLYVSARDGRKAIAHLPLIDTRTGASLRVGDLFDSDGR
jgi:hypothetical protein